MGSVTDNLQKFLAGASRPSKVNDKELAQIALVLLKTLPAAREAVLEYLCSVFENSVRKYSALSQNDQLMNAPVDISEADEEIRSEVHSVLITFITTNPQAWAPIISSWSLNLLGSVSSRYGRSIIHSTLNETLHWWMSCKAVRTLIDITTQCLHSLIETDAEVCVSSLLETSEAHSPYFDWVVALVGSCFSKTVITRVLSLGLKDFCLKARSNSGAVNNSGKLNSVVGILGHLGTGHIIDIRTSLLELFMWSLEPGERDPSQKHAVVPFLIQFAAHSPVLLNALSTDVLDKLNPELLVKIADVAVHWKPYTEGVRLEDLVVGLAIGCERGGAKIISLLLEGSEIPKNDVSLACRMIIELLLEAIDREQRCERGASVHLMRSLKNEMTQMLPLLMIDKPLHQTTLCRLLTLIDIVNPSVMIDAACYLLRNGSTASHLSTLLLLAGPHQRGSTNLLVSALEQALRTAEGNLLRNLCILLKNEKAFSEGSNKIVVRAVTENLRAVCACLRSGNQTHKIIEVLDLLPVSCFSSVSLQMRLALVKACVKYFFCSIKDEDLPRSVPRCRRVRSVLQHVCEDCAPARAAALRELIETSLFLSPSVLFGSCRKNVQRRIDTGYSLSENNLKLRTRPGMFGRQSSAFGNGVSANQVQKSHTTSAAQIEFNILQLIDVVKSCSMSKQTGESSERLPSLDAYIQTSLLLVSLISPDVMYNGLPWPEEDFCKVTIERDIHIRKVFDELPIAWQLVEMLALQQPALCYCSVLLRAMMATLLSQWASPSVANKPAVLETTLRLLRLMCLGQLLPPPLNALPQVISIVSAQEVVTLLRGCVWNFMRDNVPTPALFAADTRSGFMWRDVSTRPSAAYTEPLRLILLQNIAQFGALYRDLFVRM